MPDSSNHRGWAIVAALFILAAGCASLRLVDDGPISAQPTTARLTIRQDSLDLNVFPWGRHLINASEINVVEKVTWCPFLAWGIRITSGSQTSIFWCWGYPGSILKAMRRVGFPLNTTGV